MGKCVKSDAVPPQMLDSALLHLSPSADGAAKASLDKHGLQPRCDDDDDRESVCDHQGCISCGILVSGIGARGVSSEHMENMEMFSLSPT